MRRNSISQVFGAVTVGERGQVVIPAKIRKIHKVKPGDRLIVFAKADGPIGLIPAERMSPFLRQVNEAMVDTKEES